MSIGKVRNISERYYIDELYKLVKPHGTILYLTVSGAHLYGCDRPESDIDIKGIYLPYKTSLLLQTKCPQSIVFKGEVDGIPVDFECWSLQYVQHLLSKGDSNIIDTLYSSSNEEAVIYQIPEWSTFFNKTTIKHYILYNKMTGIVGYCNRQADKYGLKGSRLKEMNDFNVIFNEAIKDLPYVLHKKGKQKVYTEKFIEVWDKLGLEDFIHIKKVPLNKMDEDRYAISLLGRLIPEYIYIHQVQEHIDRIIGTFGKRAKLASEFDGKDFKSISHAYRAGVQYLSLLKTADLKFPLDDREYLLKIKQGDVDFDKVRSEIADMLEEIAHLDDGTVFKREKPDIRYLENIVLNMYLLESFEDYES